jgi:hypothetical protein
MMLHTKVLLTIGTFSFITLAIPSKSHADFMDDCLGERNGFSCAEGGWMGSEGPQTPDDPKYENPGTKSPRPLPPNYTPPFSETLRSSPTYSPGLAPP